jgi:mannosylglucosylglycerate synthase
MYGLPSKIGSPNHLIGGEKMKIALAHFRIGETDGVSLEMEKWKYIFEQMGHKVVYLAGSEGRAKAYVIEELFYMHPLNNKFVYNAYERLADYENEQAFKEDILAFAKIIEEKLIHFIEREQIDLLIPNNILSLGWGLPAGIAFTNAIKKTGISVICHHHDFYWERDRYSSPTCPFVQELLEQYFPPNLENVRHVVINQIAKEELYKRRGIHAYVVPNVFDFASEIWKKDQYNADFRERFDIKKDDIVILQATRITERKAIELGIDVVAEMQKPTHIEMIMKKGLYNGIRYTTKPRFVYVMAGMPESSFEYLQSLKKKAESLGVDMRYVNDYIEHSRGIKNGQKTYSLWDAYVAADLVMYPSILEGWGNQLLEAVFAKKPMVIYEYPVYQTDIANKGFSFISLGGTHTVNEDGLVQVETEKVKDAAKQAIDILTNPSLYNEVTSNNFAIGKQYYSYEALQGYLAPLIDTSKCP